MLLRLYSYRLDKKMNLCNKETGITTVSISVGGNDMNKNIIGRLSRAVSRTLLRVTALVLSAFFILGDLYE